MFWLFSSSSNIDTKKVGFGFILKGLIHVNSISTRIRNSSYVFRCPWWRSSGSPSPSLSPSLSLSRCLFTGTCKNWFNASPPNRVSDPGILAGSGSAFKKVQSRLIELTRFGSGPTWNKNSDLTNEFGSDKKIILIRFSLETDLDSKNIFSSIRVRSKPTRTETVTS